MFVIPFVIAFIALLLFFVYLNYSLSFKRSLLIKKMRDFRNDWDKVLSSDFEYYSYLNSNFKENLLDRISIFYNEKEWSHNISNEQRVLISASACLPIVNRESNFYPNIKSDFTSIDQEGWFSKNEIQFEKEIGKMPLREFKGEFVFYSIEYFKDPKAMKLNNKRFFDLLNFYYKLSR